MIKFIHIPFFALGQFIYFLEQLEYHYTDGRFSNKSLSSENIYRKVPKFLDARKLGCNLPKIQTKSPNLRIFGQKDANGIAHSEDPDLGLHCLSGPICLKT